MISLAEVLERAAAEGHLTDAAAAQGQAHCVAACWVGGLVGSQARCVDLGSGGGLPALPLACAWPESRWVLTEMRETRASFLRWAVRSLALDARVRLHEGDVDGLTGSPPGFEVVTARAFGPPAVVAEVAAHLLVEGGVVIVSEPPGRERWDRAGCGGVGLVPLLTSSTSAGRWRVLARDRSPAPSRRRVRRIRASPRFE